MDLPNTSTAYDAVADAYAALLPGLDAETPLDVAVLDDFAGRCADAGVGPVLDAGCGTGRVSAHLAARGLEVLGVDGSPGMVAVARREHPGHRFEVGRLEQLPLADDVAGGVLAWYSLIHTPPSGLAAVVVELVRVLAPGGWLLTAFQVGHGERVDRSAAYGRPVAMSSYRHDPDHVARVLETAGLEVRARLVRAAEGTEAVPQALLLAVLPAVSDPGAASGS